MCYVIPNCNPKLNFHKKIYKNSFFGMKIISSSFIIFQSSSNYQHFFAGAIEGLLKGKRRGKFTKGVWFLHYFGI
jgi:hypothetical protein